MVVHGEFMLMVPHFAHDQLQEALVESPYAQNNNQPQFALLFHGR